MKEGTLVTYLDFEGKRRCGQYAGNSKVIVIGREIEQCPVASYSAYDAYEAYRDFVMGEFELHAELWEDVNIPEASEYGTYGELWFTVDGNKESFFGYLAYARATEHFKELFSEVEVPPEEEEYEWDSFLESFAENLERVLGSSLNFLVVGENLDWRNSSGYQTLYYEKNIGSIVSKITPNSEFSMYVFDDLDGELRIRCSHHDAPTGSTMRLIPLPRVVELMGRESKIAIAKEILEEEGIDQVYVWEEVFGRSREDRRDDCITSSVHGYHENVLNRLLRYLSAEGYEDEVMEAYVKELWKKEK